MRSLTEANKETAERYQSARAMQFGNLHERVKYLIGLAKQCEKRKQIPVEILDAIWDIESEIKYIEPANPPLATRS